MKRRFSIAIFVMGFSGLAAEIILLRELLIVFSGNELSIGIILANWLILEAFGCFFFGRMIEKSQNKIASFTAIAILFSLALVLSISLTRLLKNIIGVSIGESVGLPAMIYSSFLILLPVSALHGALFTFSCKIYSLYSRSDASSIGRVYVYETIGTIIGGIFCAYLFIPYINAFHAALLIAMLNFIVCLVLLAPFRETGLRQKALLIVSGALFLVFGYLMFSGIADKLHHYSIRAQWKNFNIVHYQNSRYGNICVIENEGQYIFFQDGVPEIITPIPDIMFVEEFVHLPLLAHPEPGKILILSGGAGGVINEALKHASIERIDYAELDPLLLSLLRKFQTPLTESELNDERVKISYVDGRLFLKTAPDKYDLIFSGVMAPLSLQANRYFTKEFFTLAKSGLNEGGALVLGAPGSFSFLNDELKNLNSCIFHTLSSVFAYVRVIPGDERNIFLSSDSGEIMNIEKELIADRLNERNFEANAVFPWHIEKKLHEGWGEWFAHFIEGGSEKINYDFKPLGLFYGVSRWNAMYAPGFGAIFKQFERMNLRIIFLLFVIFCVLYFTSRSRNAGFFAGGVPLSIFTTGFAGMIFDLVVIFAFQAIYGYVFSWIGLLVASFMAGAASGASLMTNILEREKNCRLLFIKIDLSIICFSIALPLIILFGAALLNRPGLFFLLQALFLIVSFSSGVLIGFQFPLANKLYLKDGASLSGAAGRLYASDLLGGWLGGIIGAVALLPVLGLMGTCITAGLLKLASFIVITAQPQPISVRR